MNHKKATFGAGCFWGVEAIFQELDGVVATSVGYMGGNTEDPTYQDVCYSETNHAEVCEIVYDPNVISYTDLLSVFFSLHDPTTLNRQGPDVGTQYRSAIFYNDDDQKAQALDALKQIEDGKFFTRPVVTEVTKAATFYKAEDYHQSYYQNKGITPHCGIGSVNVKLKEME
ncbi:MAG TPA: peptide-methionine (S)-S-oxide reductase [candidate division Zixibacteria bacterium]|nr:peptide-methionine (S)-S-oxide reductase [candidate division Zixibacteria bacterium]